MWAGERRKRGPVIEAILADWQPESMKSSSTEGVSTGFSRDEDLITGILVMLWQGGTAEDLARWLAGSLRKKKIEVSAEELETLARKLVTAYEKHLFRD